MIVDGFRLGIDFGTSNTAAVLARPDGTVSPLRFDGALTLPSAVYVDPAARSAGGGGPDVLAGVEALRAARIDPSGFEPYPKRLVGDAVTQVGGAAMPVAELIGAVLRRVVDGVRPIIGGVPAAVTLTFPPAWGPRHRDVLLAAATAAGLPLPALVAEPVAAAAYAAARHDDVPVGGYAVVYDLGAATFDVSVLRRTPGGFELLATQGLSGTGGLAIDAAIMELLVATYADRDPTAWGRLTDPATVVDRCAALALWDDIRTAKEALSRSAATTVRLRLLGRDAPLGRAQFDHLARPVLDPTVATTRRLIGEAGLTPDDVTGLYLVGGSSRIPIVATLLHQALGIAPTVPDQPELAMAQGGIGSACAVRPASPPAFAPPVSPAAMPYWSAPDAGTPPASGGRPTPLPEPAVPRPAASSPPARPRPEPAPPRPRRRVRRVGVIAAAAAALVLVLSAVPVLVIAEPWVTRPAAILAGHSQYVESVAFSPDGRTLATAGSRTVRLWDVASARSTATLDHPGDVESVAFSPDGAVLAVASFQSVVLWDTAAGRPIGEPLAGHTAPVASVAFSPDGRTLATASLDHTARLWHVGSGQPVATLAGHGDDWVNGVAFSPDGTVLVTVGADAGVRLWDVGSGQPVAALVGHSSSVYAAAFSPDGRSLATAADGRTVHLWDVARRFRVATLADHPDAVNSAAFSPDGRSLAAASHDTVYLWDVAGRRVITTFVDRSEAFVYSVAFSPDGATLAAAGLGEVRLWKVPRG